jgi:hypothetical protein
VDWDEPVNNGKAIHAYRFYFRQSDEVTFTEESTECVGTDELVLTTRQC